MEIVGLELNQILKKIKNKNKISMSLLQKTFSIGFNRAARIFYALKDLNLIAEDGSVNKAEVERCLSENK